MMRLPAIILLLAAALALSGCGRVGDGRRAEIKMAAPDCLKNILPAAIDQFKAKNGTGVRVSYFRVDSVLPEVRADSGIDLFLTVYSRDLSRRRPMVELHDRYLSCPFRLSLVVVAGAGDQRAREFLKEGNIRQLENEYFRRVALVDPDISYEGFLAREILGRNRLLKKLQSRLIIARDREQFLNYIETGEAAAGIALASALDGREGLVELIRLDDKLQEQLMICGAVTESSRNKEIARAFLDLFDSRLCEIYNIRGVYQN